MQHPDLARTAIWPGKCLLTDTMFRRAIVITLSLCACADHPAVPAPDLRVFETSKSFTGDLVSEAGDPTLDGPHAADLLCQQSADAAQLGGTWTAYVSVGDAANWPANAEHRPHASYSVQALDRIDSDGPWYNIAGRATSSPAKVFANRDDLAHGIFHDLITDEEGYGQLAYAWTGAHNDGSPTSNDCAGWTMSAPAGIGLTPWGTAGVNDPSSYFPALFDAPYAADVVEGGDLQVRYPDPRYPPPQVDVLGLGAVDCNQRLVLYCFENRGS
jgi:hypothetical protein